MKLVCFLCLLSWAALPGRAVELELPTTTITVPEGRSFQFPVAVTHSAAGPLTFTVKSSHPKLLRATVAPASNRSLQLTVAGAANNVPFTNNIVLQLFEDLTPLTTARILELVETGFYTNLTFHRIINDFVVQGGDPAGDGTGGTGTKFDDEFEETLTFTGFGQLAMANSGDDSNDSQFFITDVDLTIANPAKLPPRHLDFNHTIFGQVTRGFDTVAQMMQSLVLGDKPLQPPVILAATVLTHSPDAVLRVTAAPGFTGSATLTITAANAARQTSTGTVTVHIVANTVNAPPFLGPIPASTVVTQGQAIAFLLTATDVDDDELFTDLQGAQSFTRATTPDGLSWLIPKNLDFTGTVNMVISLSDDRHAPDSQQFAVTILPKSVAPTLTVAPRAGRITPGTSGRTGRAKLSGDLIFTNTADQSFASNDIVVVTLGNPANPYRLQFTPVSSGRTYRKGVIRYKTETGAVPTASGTFDANKGTFKIAWSNFNFPVAPSNNTVQLAVSVGNDHGTNTTVWTSDGKGNLLFPRP